MRRLNARLAAACALAVATAVFTGAAVADPGNGNSANAPGQQKQAVPAAQPQPVQPAAQPAPTAQPQPAQKQAPGQVKKAAAAQAAPTQAAPTHAASPGQAKQAARASSASPGVKPASGTTHWTHCVTGTSSSGVTCTSSDEHTPQVKPDVSKQYGNGKTAAQIAVSRGGAGYELTGPGNSQPHKVSLCGKPSNPSGGVDVHAVKSYDTSACAPQTVTPQIVQSQSSVCGETTVTSTSTQVVGVLHGKNEHLMTNVKSAHFTKHNDQKVMVTSTQTSVVPNGESCSSQSQAPTQSSAPTQPLAPVQPSSPASVAPVATPQLPAIAAAPATSPAGGVLGAQTSLSKPATPATHARHGVLGTVTHVAGGTLPFTGFPVWMAVLVAAALMLAGVVLRRRTLGGRL